MPTYTHDPETGDLHSRTDKTPALQYFSSPIEHTLVFNRSTREQVNMGVSHWNEHQELTLTVFHVENGEPVSIKEEINLTFAEAKLLRELLNRREVVEILDQQ